MSFSQLFEVLFDIAYLVFIWILVGKMFSRRGSLRVSDKSVAEILMFGFCLLAIGDTAHVGFRVWAYLLGGLGSKLMIGNVQVPLGIGSLLTAYTVTFLYMLIVEVWRLRFKKKIGFTYIFLQAVGALRLIIMVFPQNQWSAVDGPFNWSMYRNIPLAVLGICIAALILYDASKVKDKTFKNIAYLIFISYLFYMPVILFYRIAPWVGMFMIPKTVAYVLMAVIAYKSFFSKAAVKA